MYRRLVSIPLPYTDGYRDARSLGAPVVQYVESHSDDVTEVCPGLIFMVSIHLLNHTHSCNFTQLKHHFCCLGPRTALLTSTTRPSLMKKRHCTKQSIMATLSITP